MASYNLVTIQFSETNLESSLCNVCSVLGRAPTSPKSQLALLSTAPAQRVQPSVQVCQQILPRSLAHQPGLSSRRSIRASASSSGYASRALSTRSRSFSHAETDGGTDFVPLSSWSAVRVKPISRRIFAIAISRGSAVGVGVGVGDGGAVGVGDGVDVGDGVGVGGGVGRVGVIGASCTSNAPMSLRPFFTRSKPKPR